MTHQPRTNLSPESLHIWTAHSQIRAWSSGFSPRLGANSFETEVCSNLLFCGKMNEQAHNLDRERNATKRESEALRKWLIQVGLDKFYFKKTSSKYSLRKNLLILQLIQTIVSLFLMFPKEGKNYVCTRTFPYFAPLISC